MAKNNLTAAVLTISAFFIMTACEIQGTSENETNPIPVAEKTPDPEIWNKTVAKEFLTISELKEKKPTGGIFETEGFVVDSYECSCEPIRNAFIFCKCPPESITISEQFELRDRELKLQTSSVKDFRRGQKYRFKVKISDETPDSEQLDMVYLIAYQVVN